MIENRPEVTIQGDNTPITGTQNEKVVLAAQLLNEAGFFVNEIDFYVDYTLG